MPVPVTFEVRRLYGRGATVPIFGLVMECPQLANGRSESHLVPLTFDDLQTLHLILGKIIRREADSSKMTAQPAGTAKFEELQN